MRKVIAVKTDGKRLTMFLIEGDSSYIDASAAIHLAENNDIDAIAVHPSHGEAYLRSRADDVGENNFSTIAESA